MRRSSKQIKEYLNEAWDKVWYIRSLSKSELENGSLKKSHPDIYNGMTESKKRIEDTYGTEWHKGMDNWNYGFLSGVLATLRWVLGEEDKMFLDT